MFVRRNLLAICMGAVLLVPFLSASAEDEAQGEDLSSIKQEIDALKAGQQQIGKDVAAIKQILEKLNKPRKRPEPVQDVDLAMDVSKAPMKGDADAPLVLVEMTDFQCPFCGRHVKMVMPQISKNYIDTGKVKYIVRDFPLPFHQNAQKAAEAAHCADRQGKYWEMHDLLFNNQRSLDKEHLIEYAKQIGLNEDAFKTCLEKGETAQEVKTGQADGRKAGVTGTPSLFLGRIQEDGKVRLTKRITGAQPYPVFQKAIDDMLGTDGAKKEGTKAEVPPAKPEQQDKPEAGS